MVAKFSPPIAGIKVNKKKKKKSNGCLMKMNLYEPLVCIQVYSCIFLYKNKSMTCWVYASDFFFHNPKMLSKKLAGESCRKNVQVNCMK